jgi:hypothetical protein
LEQHAINASFLLDTPQEIHDVTCMHRLALKTKATLSLLDAICKLHVHVGCCNGIDRRQQEHNIQRRAKKGRGSEGDESRTDSRQMDMDAQ